MKQKTVEVKLKQGLEARPAAMLVQVASKHASNIYLESEGRKVNAKSIMGMMSLALAPGEKVTVIADGTDEDDAIFGMENYLSSAAAGRTDAVSGLGIGDHAAADAGRGGKTVFCALYGTTAGYRSARRGRSGD